MYNKIQGDFQDAFETAGEGFGSTYDFKFKRFFEGALILPLAVPTYIAAYAYEGVFGTWIMGKPGIIWIFASVLFPYVYLVCRASFRHQSANMIEAARSLGKSRLSVFFNIQVPLARPAIVAGLSLVIMETVNDYGAFDFFGINTFTTGIFVVRDQFNDTDSVRLAACLLFFMLAFIFIERLSRGKRSYADSQNYKPIDPVKLNWKQSLVVYLVLFIPLTSGFILPVVKLISWSALYMHLVDGTEFFNAVKHSFTLALGAALFISIAGLLITWASRAYSNPVINFLKRCCTVGYAVPGVIIGIAVIGPFLWLDRHLFLDIVKHFQPGTRQFIYGTMLTLFFAYLVRFLAVSINPIDVSFKRMGMQVHEASRSLGKSRFMTFLKVELPVMYPSVIFAFILLFVDILKELPLTMLLCPSNFDTLATLTYLNIKNEEYALPSVFSLVIIIAGMLAVFILNKQLYKE